VAEATDQLKGVEHVPASSRERDTVVNLYPLAPAAANADDVAGVHSISERTACPPALISFV
jgi:hypothetical protein